MKAYVIHSPAHESIAARAARAIGVSSPVEVVDLPDETMMDEIRAILGAKEVEYERIYEFGDVVFRAQGDTSGKVVVVGKNQYGEWTQPEASEDDMVRMLRDKAT